MKVVCIGGGPAGLYLAILLRKVRPECDVTVVERNPPNQTYGWGVVFSDETLGYLGENDLPTHREITRTFAHWDAIDIHVKGRVLRSSGHGFSGIARKKLLSILKGRCEELGVRLVFDTEVEDLAPYRDADLLVGSDGVRSRIRAAHADVFRPSLDPRRCRYMWLGTTRLFDAFTFLFEENEHGLFQVHAYRFDEETSTFIVECDEASWRRAGLDLATPAQSVAYLERLFARHLRGHRLLENHSSWINFVTVKNQTWRHGRIVLVGDAAHTAHFSIGSGTKLAMEDAIALAGALRDHPSVDDALEAYEAERRPVVERTQRAAQDSLLWFENARRYLQLEPEQFAMSLLTRSKRITYDNLRLRDAAFVDRVHAWFLGAPPRGGDDAQAKGALAAPAANGPPPAPSTMQAPRVPRATRTPPMFTRLRLRELVLENRVVCSPMCMYSAEDGEVNDFHLVHLGARAMGGAGLILTEMTNVSPEGRISPGCAGMYRPEHVASWRRVVEFVHRRSRARIGLQLGHAGRKGSTRVPWEGEDEPLPFGNWPLLSASPIPYREPNQVPREMDRRDMDLVREQFVRAARMAEEAGFDWLELHMAHGYLLSSFLSPLTNTRRDAHGGSLENRMRYPLEVFEAVRAAWPSERPMSVRISATDWVEGGFEAEDAVVFARALAARGLDIINVSTGQTTPEARPVYGRMWQARFSDQVRQEAGVPTMVAGNITTPDQVNTLLVSGRADLVLLARPFLYDPHWVLHAAAEQGYHDAPWPAPYLAARPRPPDG